MPVFVRRFVYIAWGLFSLAPSLGAQPPAGPGAVVADYWSATQEGDWGRAASLVHPESLDQLHASMKASVSKVGPDTTFQEVMLGALLGVESLAEFEALDASQAFIRFLTRQAGSPARREALKATTVEITAETLESSDAARVEYVLRTPGETPEPGDFSLRRRDGRWLILFPSG